MKSLLISAIATGTAAELFIVKLKDGAIGASEAFPSASITQTYSIGETFNAFAVETDDIAEFEESDLVEYVSPNVEFELFVPLPEDEEDAQVDSWGLDRVDQRRLPLDDSYTAFGSGGAGVTVYVIDSGVLDSHPDFEGRARFGFNGAGGSNADAVGHGTHVGGTVASATYGVAPNAEVVSVKVCGGRTCALNAIVSGVDWAARDARGKRAVANMSLGGPTNRAIDDAVSAAIAGGLPIVAASGNSNRDACSFSPARVPTAVTVNASTIRDGKASFSNFGRCSDVWAPGDGITSLWLSNGTRTISGTSMAAPHVAGIMALYLGERNYTPAQLSAAIVGAATEGVISNPGSGSPNLLAFNRP